MEKYSTNVQPLLRDLFLRDTTPEDTLQDLIFDEFDKLQALCSAQTIIDTTEDMSCSFIKNRGHFSTVIEDQAKKTRSLLDRYFS